MPRPIFEIMADFHDCIQHCKNNSMWEEARETLNKFREFVRATAPNNSQQKIEPLESDEHIALRTKLYQTRKTPEGENYKSWNSYNIYVLPDFKNGFVLKKFDPCRDLDKLYDSLKNWLQTDINTIPWFRERYFDSRKIDWKSLDNKLPPNSDLHDAINFLTHSAREAEDNYIAPKFVEAHLQVDSRNGESAWEEADNQGVMVYMSSGMAQRIVSAAEVISGYVQEEMPGIKIWTTNLPEISVFMSDGENGIGNENGMSENNTGYGEITFHEDGTVSFGFTETPSGLYSEANLKPEEILQIFSAENADKVLKFFDEEHETPTISYPS